MSRVSIILPLLNNAALLLALGLLYETIGIHRRGSRPNLAQIFSGFLLGIICIALMSNPLDMGEGVIFDTRSVLLSLSGLFFGVLPTSIAVLIASGFRMYLGGAGSFTGVSVILTTAALGVFWRHYRPRSRENYSLKELLLFGVIIHLVMLLLMFTLPGNLSARILPQITLPVMTLYPLATALLGWLMTIQQVRRQTEESLRESEEIYRSLFANNHAVMLLINPQDGQIVDANPAAEQFYGWERQILLQKKIAQINTLTEEEIKAEMAKAKAYQRNHFLFRHRLANGEIRHVEVYSGPIRVAGRTLLYSIIHDITQSVEAEQERNLLTNVITASLNEIYLFDAQTLRFKFVNQGACRNLQRSVEELKQLTPLDLKPAFDRQSFEQLLLPLRSGEKDQIVFETFHRRADGSDYPIEVHLQYFKNEGLFLAVINDISERKRAEKALHQRLRELETLSRLSAALREAETSAEFLPVILDETLSIFDTPAGAIWVQDAHSAQFRMVVGRAWLQELNGKAELWKPIWDKLSLDAQHRLTTSLLVFKPTEQLGESTFPQGWRLLCSPLQAETELFGVLTIAVPPGHRLGDEHTHLLTSIADMSSSTLHRMRLHEETLRRTRQLQSLRSIDNVITNLFDLRMALEFVCNQASDQLGVDAVGILIYSPLDYTLKYIAGYGFRGQEYSRSMLRLGEGQAGTAAEERRIIQLVDLAKARPPFSRQGLLDEEKFVSYAAAPLLSKGQLKGVLEVFHRSPLQFNTEWTETLQAFALQAAIAMDNIQMLENLQRLNAELMLAYDATIEGWSKAVELKDRETQEHSQRVVDLTLKVAQAMGVEGESLIHLRRGALLHDIGKMGIPDSILLKPGTLDEEEWEEVKKHPRYAFEWLSAITYLRPALDIPYSHHEKWDGSGYPLGLKGVEIPLAARIFAVVDVWDALTSDRPYRKAWSREEAKKYLREQAGKHFDPEVVKVFLENIDQWERGI